MSTKAFYQDQQDSFNHSLNENEIYGDFYYHYKIDDLIMLRNSQENYFFSSFGIKENKSPVFKVKGYDYKGDQAYLQLIVMEVLYPVPLYRNKSPYKGILYAIKDEMAVVKETSTVINFSMNPSYQVENVALKEIYCLEPIELKARVMKECACSKGCEGYVRAKSRRKLTYILSDLPLSGKVDLNEKTGHWLYKSYTNKSCEDSFVITVWDGLGTYEVQTITLKCEGEYRPPKSVDVNVVNSPLVRLKEPIGIDGNVSIKGIKPMAGALPVTGELGFNFPTSIELTLSSEVSISGVTPLNGSLPITGTVDLDPRATVSISGTPTVVIDQPIGITGDLNVSISGLTLVDGALPIAGTVQLAPESAVAITGTPTVLIDQALEITGIVAVDGVVPVEISGMSGGALAVELTGDPAVIISAFSLVDEALPVEISGVSILAGSLSVTGAVDLDPDATVSISGTPTVLIDQPVEVTGFVELTGDSTVSINGLTLVDGAVPVEISGIPALNFAGVVDFAPDATVSISGTPTILIDRALEVTGVVSIEGLTIMDGVVPVEISGMSGGALAVELTGDPAVIISGFSLVDEALPVEISGVSILAGSLSITGVVDLDPDATVSISGTPTVLIEQPVEVTGFVELTGDPAVIINGLSLTDEALPVEISGVSVLDGALTLTGVIDLDPDATVSISGTPTVLIEQPVSIAYTRSFTSIELENTILSGVTSVTSLSVDVSQYIDYSFIVYLTNALSTTVSSYTVLTQIAALDNDIYYFNNGTITGDIDGLGTTESLLTIPDHLAQYARLVISASTPISEDGPTGLSVQAFFQGQY